MYGGDGWSARCQLSCCCLTARAMRSAAACCRRGKALTCSASADWVSSRNAAVRASTVGQDADRAGVMCAREVDCRSGEREFSETSSSAASAEQNSGGAVRSQGMHEEALGRGTSGVALTCGLLRRVWGQRRLLSAHGRSAHHIRGERCAGGAGNAGGSCARALLTIARTLERRGAPHGRGWGGCALRSARARGVRPRWQLPWWHL